VPLQVKSCVLGALGGEGCFVLLETALVQALTTGLHALFFGLCAEVGVNQRPCLRPTVIADEIAQGKHGVDMAALPVHAGAFEAGFNDRLVGG
jgi:hypothetical protein